MGILKRFNDIMASNINALLDKAEDPEKMVDQTLRNLQEDFGKVKAETAGVMADEKRAKRELDEAKAEADKYANYAQKAVAAGNDDDARTFLQKKAEVTQNIAGLQAAYDAAHENSVKMQQMYDKLSKDIETLEAKRDTIKAKIRTAKAQERVNKMTSSIPDSADSLSTFDRLEKQADRMLDKAQAEEELNGHGKTDTSALEEKYADNASKDADIEAELAALKANM